MIQAGAISSRKIGPTSSTVSTTCAQYGRT
jgi:hypothetical protein